MKNMTSRELKARRKDNARQILLMEHQMTRLKDRDLILAAEIVKKEAEEFAAKPKGGDLL